MITDFELFRKLLKGICEQTALEVVGISGGEPFTERNGLVQACNELSAHKKKIVIYTSGVWAKTLDTPGWIQDVLRTCCTVYLSTDSFHQGRVPPLHFQRAAIEIANAGAWIVIQTLEAETTTQLLTQTFGTNWHNWAEVVPIKPLRNGRGSNIFNVSQLLPGSAMGTCSLAETPVIRYDGTVTSCCNEDVIMGHGPDRFRSKVGTIGELNETLARFKHDPVMKCVAQVGLGQLLMHPRLNSLSKRHFSNNCDLCWNVMKKFPALPEPDRLMHAIAELGEVDE